MARLIFVLISLCVQNMTVKHSESDTKPLVVVRVPQHNKLHISIPNIEVFSYFCIKIVGRDDILMCTHDMCFHAVIRKGKKVIWIPRLTIAM